MAELERAGQVTSGLSLSRHELLSCQIQGEQKGPFVAELLLSCVCV